MRTAISAVALMALTPIVGYSQTREAAPADEIPATGQSDPRMESFDRMMRVFLAKHDVPGASLAVTDGGRLVYARGYGYADVEARKQIAPTSLFRIASISKPITAVAILKLVEQERLDLDDRVLELLDFPDDIAAIDDFDARQRAITIGQLLTHTGGWDRDASFDPMFQSVRFAKEFDVPSPAGTHEVIRAMLRRKLDFNPGERFAYSNYGYCLLGRVIEKASGRPYEQYVQEQVLAPLGIRSMQIGHSQLAERAKGEVRYYQRGVGPSVFAASLGEDVPLPYGTWHHESLDAHGGWIASAVDLARFACALNDPDKSKLLSPASVATMHALPAGPAWRDDDGRPKEVYYSLGWFNRVVGEGKVNHWHNGALPGTATILIRRHDGRNFIALFNANSGADGIFLGSAIDPLLHAAADEVNQWPEEDSFGRE